MLNRIPDALAGSVKRTCFSEAWHTSHRVEVPSCRGLMASASDEKALVGLLGLNRASSVARRLPVQLYDWLSLGATSSRYSPQGVSCSSASSYSAAMSSSSALRTVSALILVYSCTRCAGSSGFVAQHRGDCAPVPQSHP